MARYLGRAAAPPEAPPGLDAAGRLAPPQLRTLDAIHVQCALLLGDELEGFVTYDERTAAVARAAGLPVLAPA